MLEEKTTLEAEDSRLQRLKISHQQPSKDFFKNVLLLTVSPASQLRILSYLQRIFGRIDQFITPVCLVNRIDDLFLQALTQVPSTVLDSFDRFYEQAISNVHSMEKLLCNTQRVISLLETHCKAETTDNKHEDCVFENAQMQQRMKNDSRNKKILEDDGYINANEQQTMHSVNNAEQQNAQTSSRRDTVQTISAESKTLLEQLAKDIDRTDRLLTQFKRGECLLCANKKRQRSQNCRVACLMSHTTQTHTLSLCNTRTH